MESPNYMARLKAFAGDMPWNVTRPEELGPCTVQFVKDYDSFYRRWAEKWFEIFQFLYGNQSVRWSKRWGFAVDVDFLRRVPSINMRAQTNISRVVYEGLLSYIFGQLPAWEVEAMQESSLKGRSIKKIVGDWLDAQMIRLNMEDEFLGAAGIFTGFGQVCTEVSWRKGAGQIMDVPQYRRVQSPVYTTAQMPDPISGTMMPMAVPSTDMQGMPIMEDKWEPILDQFGRQVINTMSIGDIHVKTRTPFEYRREIGSSGMHDTKYVQTFDLLDYDEFLDIYGDIEGQTANFNQIRPVYNDPTIYSFAIQHFMRMKFTAPPNLVDNFRRNDSIFNSRMFKHKVFVINHWDKPHNKKWPLGRRLVIANGVCTHITVPQFHTNTMGGWHPFSEAMWLKLMPSPMAAGPMNDIVAKNREINIKDSLIATAVRRNMGSTLLTKVGAGIDPQKLTGEPGGVHEVNDVYGARWLHDEMPIPPVITRLREMDLDDIYNLSGAGEALRGQPSEGATSGYQEKQREEREEKRLTPAKRQFEKMVSGTGMKMFSCMKANVKQLDSQTMGYLKRSAAGEYEIGQAVTLLTTPVDYGIDITVKRSSMAIKSEATKQATLLELLAGVAAAQAQDPEVMDNVLRRFEMEDLRDENGIHRDRANRENEVFLDMLRLGPNLEGIQRPIVFIEDNDMVHIRAHERNILQNADALRNSPETLQAHLAHLYEHHLAAETKVGAQLPGTQLLANQLTMMNKNQPLPTLQNVQVNTMMKQQQAGLAPTKGKGKPKSNLPAPPTGGAGPINPAAPAALTPTAASQGGV